MSIDLSIVIPALNEREALPGLLAEIEAACDPLGIDWEAIVVDDGSTDGTFQLVAELGEERPWLRCIRLRRNFGKSAALSAGLDRCTGERVMTIDADGQDDPADIPRLLAALLDADLVCGWKQERRDPLGRRLASRVFNAVTRRLTGLALHDMNCGIKAFRGECARSLALHGDMHRYIPVLAAQQGWRVTELPVNHRPRRHGNSRFGSERYLRGAFDLVAVVFIGRYEYRPLHLFGSIGAGLTVGGVGILGFLTISKVVTGVIGHRPLLILGVLLVVIGIQLLTFGLLAEMIVVARRDRHLDQPGVTSVQRVAGFDRNLRPVPGSGQPARATSARS